MNESERIGSNFNAGWSRGCHDAHWMLDEPFSETARFSPERIPDKTPASVAELADWLCGYAAGLTHVARNAAILSRRGKTIPPKNLLDTV